MSHSNWNRFTFPWQQLCAVLGHWWLNYLLQTGKCCPRVFVHDGVIGVGVSKSSLWCQSWNLFIGCQCSRAPSFINQILMLKNCRDRIYDSSQLFKTGWEKGASQINVFIQRTLTSYYHPDHCSLVLWFTAASGNTNTVENKMAAVCEGAFSVHWTSWFNSFI